MPQEREALHWNITQYMEMCNVVPLPAMRTQLFFNLTRATLAQKGAIIWLTRRHRESLNKHDPVDDNSLRENLEIYRRGEYVRGLLMFQKKTHGICRDRTGVHLIVYLCHIATPSRNTVSQIYSLTEPYLLCQARRSSCLNSTTNLSDLSAS